MGLLFIQICAICSKTGNFSTPQCVLAVQGRSRSSKVDFVTNRKRVCDFLLVRHFVAAVWPPFLRYGDLLAKNAYFSYPSLIRRHGAILSEDRMIVAWVVLTQCQRVTDRQTDRRTDLL